jgi:phosphohistidine phosphatase
MKRRIVLIRHAKSSWANPLQSDYDRPLNDRGLHDAPIMGERLKAKAIIPDLIIASTAKRAAQTARLIATAVGYDIARIDWQEKLYHCISSVFEEVISTLDDAVKTVFIVAHNPGVSEFAGDAAAWPRIDHMPTCGVAGIELEAAHWYNYNYVERQVFLFDYPKKEND